MTRSVLVVLALALALARRSARASIPSRSLMRHRLQNPAASSAMIRTLFSARPTSLCRMPRDIANTVSLHGTARNFMASALRAGSRMTCTR
jgi:hypothetical protein